VNALDVAIVLLLAWQLYLGYERGFWLTVLVYVGAAAGFLVGTALAPYALERLANAGPATQIAVTVAILLGGAAAGGRAGALAGGPLRTLVRSVRPTRLLDAVGGALLTAAVTLALVWYISLAVSRVPQFAVASLITESAALQWLDRLAPEAPPLLARLQGALSDRITPEVFAGLEPRFPTDLAPDPATASTPAVVAAAQAVVRITGIGCGGLRVGSGFPVGDGRVVTNAHVVSGTHDVTVRAPGGQALPADVVLIDPARDVAVLVAASLDVPPLALADGEPGAPAAIIGYPGGGREVITPAVIVRQIRARGRDIYDDAVVTRDIWVVRGVASPGDSGGPLVDRHGRAVGVVFAASTSQRETAYALTIDEVAPDLERARTLTAAIDTGALECVR